MASFNRVILIGNLTRDPDLRYITSGTAVVDIGLAVNDKVKRNNEWVDEVTFVDVTLWGRTAEVAGEYLSKGSPVFIEGRLKLDTWEKEGQKHSKLKVVCDRMQLIGSRGGNQGGGSQGGGRPRAAQSSQYSQPAPPDDFGLPSDGPSNGPSNGPSDAPGDAPGGDDIPF